MTMRVVRITQRELEAVDRILDAALRAGGLGVMRPAAKLVAVFDAPTGPGLFVFDDEAVASTIAVVDAACRGHGFGIARDCVAWVQRIEAAELVPLEAGDDAGELPADPSAMTMLDGPKVGDGALQLPDEPDTSEGDR